MSKNKHGWSENNGISRRYMDEELGPWRSCPKKKCDGTMVETFVRYVNHGPIFKDLECTECGKVKKDPCTFGYFKEINAFNRELRRQKGSNRRKRIFTDRVKLSRLMMLINPNMQAYLYENWAKGQRILTPKFIARPKGESNDTTHRERRGSKNRRVSKR